MTTPIPTTQAEADAWFRCEVHSCAMSGKACAERWSRAQDADERGVVVAARAGTRGFSVSMKSCVGCPIGEARHQLGAADRAPQLHQIEAPRPAGHEPEEDTMRKRSDLTATERLVLAWAHGRDWWARKDVDEGVDRGEHAVGRALRRLQSLGLLEAQGKTVARRYCETLEGAARVAAESLVPPSQPPPLAPPPPPPPKPTMPGPRLEPAEPSPPAKPAPAAEVVELQPEVSTEAVPEPPEVTPAQVDLDRAADRYIGARDALQAGAELAARLLDEGVEVEVIACANALKKLATALEASFTALDEARSAVAAEQYDALLQRMGVAA